MSFSDFKTAAQLRDVITQIARGVIRQERPPHAYGIVTDVDYPGHRAAVQFTGEGGSVWVPMGTIRPWDTGLVVRVAGDGGDRFIQDVLPKDDEGASEIRVSGVYIYPYGGSDGQFMIYGPGTAPNWNTSISGTALRWSVGKPGSVVRVKFDQVWPGLSSNLGLQVSGGDVDLSVGSNSLKVHGVGGTDPAAPETISIWGATGGISFADRTGTGTRWVTYATGSVWSLWSSNGASPGDRLRVKNNGQANISHDGVARNDFNNNALTVGSIQLTNGWNSAGIRVASSGPRASLALHAGNGAPQIQQPANMDEIWFVNNAGTGFVPIVASAFTPSSERFKRDVQAATPGTIGKGNWSKFTDLNKRVPVRKWKKAETLKALDPQTGRSVDHVCGVHCTYDAQTKCPGKRYDDMDKLGFTAEEVEQFLPEAVKYDQETDQPLALDLSALVAALWGAVSELTDRVAALETARPQPPGGGKS